MTYEYFVLSELYYFLDIKTSGNKLFNTQSPFSFKPTASIPETVKEEVATTNDNEPSDEVKDPERNV